MPRVRIELPQNFAFTTNIPIRITDLNYGGHVGNDTILSLIHEARVLFLAHHGYTELNLAGSALIMGDVAIEFKKEIFYGDTVLASVTAGDFSRVGFTLFYKLEKLEKEQPGQENPGDGNQGKGNQEKGNPEHGSQGKASPGEGSQGKSDPEKRILLAIAQTGMVCYNYELKKVAAVPTEAVSILQ